MNYYYKVNKEWVKFTTTPMEEIDAFPVGSTLTITIPDRGTYSYKRELPIQSIINSIEEGADKDDVIAMLKELDAN